MKIGVVSDTHGLLRLEVARALAGVERILHLGDVGKPSVLTALAKIAPVTTVRGNVDREGPCGKLPETEVSAHRGPLRLHAPRPEDAAPGPRRRKFAAVLFGHTHVPNFYKKKGVLYFNPGSCGPAIWAAGDGGPAHRERSWRVQSANHPAHPSLGRG